MFDKSSGTKQKTLGKHFENTTVCSVRDIVNFYKNHSSIIKIVQAVSGFDVSDSERFSLTMVNENKTS